MPIVAFVSRWNFPVLVTTGITDRQRHPERKSNAQEINLQHPHQQRRAIFRLVGPFARGGLVRLIDRLKNSAPGR